MRCLPLLACLSPLLALLPLQASAAEVCDVPPRFGLSPLAVAIVQTACNEHRLWYRPFIDRDGRAASLSVTEAEDVHLADNGLVAWQRVVGYWRQSGTLSPMGSQPGASSCMAPPGTRYTDSDCRAFLVDNPWSAAFISWVMTRASVPGFTRSPRHIDYIRAAYQNSGPYRMTDVGGDRTLYLVGGNVMNTVAMRKLSLDRSGRIELPPAKATAGDGVDLGCTPGREEECSFNRQDWAALLKLVATAPAAVPMGTPDPAPLPAPGATAPPMAAPASQTPMRAPTVVPPRPPIPNANPMPAPPASPSPTRTPTPTPTTLPVPPPPPPPRTS